MEDKAVMLIIYLIFAVAIIMVIIGLLAYTGQLDLPKFDFWTGLAKMFENLGSKVPGI
ncbi:MAG: hypothetical protein QXU82_01475 [Candidatus Aenigmatarchaeota archaeon]